MYTEKSESAKDQNAQAMISTERQARYAGLGDGSFAFRLLFVESLINKVTT
jgi:hypothetical protein